MAKQYHSFNTILFDKGTGIMFLSNELQRDGQESLFEMYNPETKKYEFQPIDSENFTKINLISPIEGKGDINISYHFENGQSYEAIREIYKQISGLDNFEKIFETNKSKLDAIKEVCKVEYDEKISKEKQNRSGNPTFRFECLKNLIAKLDRLGIERDIYIYANSDNPDAGSEYDEYMKLSLTESPYLDYYKALEEYDVSNKEYEYYKTLMDTFEERQGFGTPLQKFGNWMSDAADGLTSVIIPIICRIGGLINAAIHHGPGAMEYYKTAAKLHPILGTRRKYAELRETRPAAIAARNETIRRMQNLHEKGLYSLEHKEQLEQQIKEFQKELQDFKNNRLEPMNRKIENQKTKISNLEKKLEKAIADKKPAREIEKIKANLATERKVLVNQLEKVRGLEKQFNEKQEKLLKIMKDPASKKIEKPEEKKDKKVEQTPEKKLEPKQENPQEKKPEQKNEKPNEEKGEKPEQKNEKPEENKEGKQEKPSEKPQEKNEKKSKSDYEKEISDIKDKIEAIDKNADLSKDEKEKLFDEIDNEIEQLESDIVDNYSGDDIDDLLEQIYNIDELSGSDLEDALKEISDELGEINNSEISKDNIEKVKEKMDEIISKLDSNIDVNEQPENPTDSAIVKEKPEESNDKIKDEKPEPRTENIRLNILDKIDNFIKKHPNDISETTKGYLDEIKNLITEIEGKISNALETPLEINVEQGIEIKQEPVLGTDVLVNDNEVLLENKEIELTEPIVDFFPELLDEDAVLLLENNDNEELIPLENFVSDIVIDDSIQITPEDVINELPNIEPSKETLFDFESKNEINKNLLDVARKIDSESPFSNVELNKNSGEIKVDEFNPRTETNFEYSLGCTDRTKINTLRIEQVGGESINRLEIVLNKDLSQRIYYSKAEASTHNQQIEETKFEGYMKAIESGDIEFITLDNGERKSFEEALKDEKILPILGLLVEYCSDSVKEEIEQKLENNDEIIENKEKELERSAEEDDDDSEYNNFNNDSE